MVVGSCGCLFFFCLSRDPYWGRFLGGWEWVPDLGIKSAPVEAAAGRGSGSAEDLLQLSIAQGQFPLIDGY